jgi:hypothetical protein
VSFNREAGKGSAPRKKQDQEKYSAGYDRIFGKDKKKDSEKQTDETNQAKEKK